MSYEQNIRDKKEGPSNIDIPLLKFLWKSVSIFEGPMTIPKFLRNIDLLRDLSYGQLKSLSQYLHHRSFDPQEVIFKQGQTGIGFYLVYSGYVDAVADKAGPNMGSKDPETTLVTTLTRFDHFGEMALLQDNSIRNVTMVAQDRCELLGIFQPDIDNMIDLHPTIAAKLIQAVSRVVANRSMLLLEEIKRLNYKIASTRDQNEQHLT